MRETTTESSKSLVSSRADTWRQQISFTISYLCTRISIDGDSQHGYSCTHRSNLYSAQFSTEKSTTSEWHSADRLFVYSYFI